MENATEFVTALLAVIALATAGGVGFQRGKIGALRRDLQDEREKTDRLEDDLAAARQEAKELRTDLDALTRVVTGEVHWIAISQQLTDHDGAAREHWTEQRDLLQRIATGVERKT